MDELLSSTRNPSPPRTTRYQAHISRHGFENWLTRICYAQASRRLLCDDRLHEPSNNQIFLRLGCQCFLQIKDTYSPSSSCRSVDLSRVRHFHVYRPSDSLASPTLDRTYRPLLRLRGLQRPCRRLSSILIVCIGEIGGKPRDTVPAVGEGGCCFAHRSRPSIRLRRLVH